MSNQQRIEQHILFYTRECQYCNKFNKILQEYPDLNVLFKKLAIEDIQRIPPQLREVPAIVIDGKQLLQSQEAFDWLKEKVKDSFGAGPELNPKGGFQDLGFTYLDGTDNDPLNSSNFSSISGPNTITDQQQEVKNVSSNDIKQDEMNNMYERMQRERANDTPQKGPPPSEPNFALPM